MANFVDIYEGLTGVDSLLDTDGDGSIIDDLAGFLIKGGGSATQKGSKVIPGSLMGGFTGRK